MDSAKLDLVLTAFPYLVIEGEDLMLRAGHSSPAAALRYQHATQGQDRAIAYRLDKMIERSAGDGGEAA